MVARLLAVAAALLVAVPGDAAIDVAPTLIDVPTTGAAATTLRLRNTGASDVRLQVRVQRWQQVGGTETLSATADAAASPPFATIPSGASYTVRVVRFAKTPVNGEETYRVLDDELPPPRSPDGRVLLAVRQSIPVFFRNPAARPAQLEWRAETHGGALTVSVANAGQVRARIADLRVVLKDGTSLPIATGLSGYALGGGGRGWTVPVGPLGALAGSTVAFRTELGAQTAPLAVVP